MEDIVDDCLNIILNYLRPIDKLVLSSVNKRYNNYKINFLELMTNFLEKCLPMSLTPKQFLLLMRESGGHISGSIILQLLYDEKWDNTDLDIIIPTKFPFSEDGVFSYDGRIEVPFDDKSFNLGKCCLLNGFVKEQQDCSDQLLCLNEYQNRIRKHRTKSYGLIPAIMYKFVYNNFPINFIYIENIQTYEYINFYFDYSVCKNMYDGIKLKMCDLGGIIKRVTQNNIDYSRYRHMVNHSYNGWNKQDSIKLIEEQSKKRKDKYINRGFTLIDYE